MEKPASPEALASYDQQLRDRYGDEIALASLYLFLHPTDSEAHARYFKAIENSLKGITR